MIKIKIPFRTPSINNLYGKTFRHNSVYLKPEGKELKKEIKSLVDKFVLENIIILDPQQKFKVTVEIHEDWLTKKGTVKKKDVANREKFIIDSVFEALGLEDSYIYEHTMKKVQSEKQKDGTYKEFAIVKIEEFKC